MPDPDRRLDAVRRRVERMGLAWREAPGGGSLLVQIPFASGPLRGAEGRPLPWDRAVFATAGGDRIKCLAPPPLFFLPLISVAGCATGKDVEERIRRAWGERQGSLGELRGWLEARGCTAESRELLPVLEIPLGLEDPEARARAWDRRTLVLPGRGPLSGRALRRAEDRRLPLDPGLGSQADLEIAVTARLEELRRIEERLARRERLRPATSPVPARTVGSRSAAPVLLVGSGIGGDAALREALRLGGCAPTVVAGAADALRAFDRGSFELVISDFDLGRSEGTELLMALRSAPGLEEVPFVLADTRLRPERRELARRLGAAGYLARPLDLPRLEKGLIRLVRSPRRRRFSRYAVRLGVRAAGGGVSELAGQIGRGGMRLHTERELAPGARERYAILLPHGHASLEVEGQILYRTQPGPLERGGVGVRFEGFAPGHEERLVAWLRSLEPART